MFICKSEKSPLKTRLKLWDGVASLTVVDLKEGGREVANQVKLPIRRTPLSKEEGLFACNDGSGYFVWMMTFPPSRSPEAL